MNTRKPFDIMDQFAKFGLERNLSLHEQSTASGFIKYVGSEIKRGLKDGSLLHGKRTEAMFEALVISLGKFKLIKKEDNGFVIPDKDFSVPDFRLVLDNGEHWLVEVKNVYEKNPGKKQKKLMNLKYYQKLKAYSTATGAQLKLAIFWARLRVWTLVSPEKVMNENGDLILDMGQAVKINEMAAIGDMSVGVRSPLLFRIITDPGKANLIGEDGKVQFTIGGFEVYCGGEEVVDSVEMEIVWIFMHYGEWEESGPEPEVDGNILKAIEFRWEPLQRSENGFDIIGDLSRMFSKYYTEVTVKDREVVQVRAPHRPNWLASIRSLDIKRAKLKLWRFIQQPNFEDSHGSIQADKKN